MLNISREEIKTKSIFLHYLYLTKINKERKNISRNGKMPDKTQKFDSKKGYKTYCLITLRKYLEGLFPAKYFQINKQTYTDRYTISVKDRYTFGKSSLMDNLVYLDILRVYGGIPHNNTIENSNHIFTIESAGSSIGRRSPLLAYEVNFHSKEQTFIPVAWDRFEHDIESNANTISIGSEKQAIAAMTQRLFDRMKNDNMIKQDVLRRVVVQTSTPTDQLTSLSVKYRIPKTILEQFLESFNTTLEGTRGFSSGMVFEFVKTTNNTLHERIDRLEYNDFESLVA